jgi:hypothetical protein
MNMQDHTQTLTLRDRTDVCKCVIWTGLRFAFILLMIDATGEGRDSDVEIHGIMKTKLVGFAAVRCGWGAFQNIHWSH